MRRRRHPRRCLPRSRSQPRKSKPTLGLYLWLCRCRPFPRAPSEGRHTRTRPTNLLPPPRNPGPPGGTSQESRRAAHPLRQNRSTMAVDHFHSRGFSARVTPRDPPGCELLRRPLGLCLAVLLVCLSLGPCPLAAQGLGLGAASADRPIAISAEAGIEWQQDAQVYIARGNAVAKRGTTEVYADTLTAHYRPSKGAGGDTEIHS